MMLRCSTVLLLCSMFAGAGCYDPRPRSGAYSCASAGAACPDNQRCVCGQCVAREEEAACAFTAEAIVPPCTDPPPNTKLTACVHEHEPFTVDVTALQKDGKTPATGYSAGVLVDGTWGDAHLHDERVEFRGGKATIHVSLNRETIGQSRARVIVRAGTASGATQGVAGVTRKLAADKDAVLLPQGWANLVTMMPNVVRDDAGALRMYFAGVGVEGNQIKNGIGIATPGAAGAPWQMQARPVLGPPLGDFAKDNVMGPAVYRAADGGWRMIFRGTNPGSEVGDFGLARSKDGLTGWELASNTAVLSHGACNFCMKGLDFATVLADPAAPVGALDLYFTTGLVNASTDALGHAATIDDGATWDVDPIRVPFAGYQGQQSEVIGAAQVVREGSVYKMYYAYLVKGVLLTALLPCPGDLRLDIGYATSEDGVLFIRSPSNPVLTGAPPWASSPALVPGSPVLIDPADPSKGLLLFYSVVQTVKLPVGGLCVPVGIARATRP